MRQFVSVVIVLVLVFSIENANGQGYTFKVLVNKGHNLLKREGSSLAVAIKTGFTLNRGDELIVSNEGYIGLVHKSGNILEIKIPGTNMIANLEKMVSARPVGVAGKYAKLLADKMSGKEQSNYRQKLIATMPPVSTFGGGNKIQVLIPPENAIVFEDDAIITWDTPKNMQGNEFIVTLKNIFDEDIMKKKVTGNSVELNFTKSWMQNNEKLWIINVTAKNNQNINSEDFVIKRSKNPSQYEENIRNLKAEIKENSPLNRIIYASFFEENDLVIDALTTIEKAIKVNPEVVDFKILKMDIIERIGIKFYENAKQMQK